jgi:hypothetical protein
MKIRVTKKVRELLVDLDKWFEEMAVQDRILADRSASSSLRNPGKAGVGSGKENCEAMSDSEMVYQLKEIVRLVVEVRNAQGRDCRHAHHCHRIPDLYEAKGIARELYREMEIRQGEQLVAAVKR